uniref:Uncharacterized protein n=1 Tax=Micrurus paraensis TaxID=1970185 RepID=A0A2D4KLV2_9SAUR
MGSCLVSSVCEENNDFVPHINLIAYKGTTNIGGDFQNNSRNTKNMTSQMLSSPTFWHVRNVNRFSYWSEQGKDERERKSKLNYQLNFFFYYSHFPSMTVILKCITAATLLKNLTYPLLLCKKRYSS